MVKVGSKVYVYPEVCHGIIRQISNGRYLVEFSSPDADGTYIHWYDYNEIRPTLTAKK